MTTITDSKRILIEDILKHSYKSEQANRQPTLESIAGALHIHPDEVNPLIAKMMERHLLELVGDVFRLTPAGQDYALQVIRAHRLWERYLADETGVAEAEWHTQAERHEHQLSAAEVEALAARLGHPIYDPHGDPIPTAAGEFVPHGGQPLVTLEPGSLSRIVHLEDEPPTVYAQLVAEGLHPGMRLQLTEKSAQRLRFVAEGETHVLAPLLARNITVMPLAEAEMTESRPQERLSSLKIGQSARVTTLSPVCRGAERRRLMDLGILPGTLVRAEMVSPSGDPTAYLIRQSLIGLRKEQADLIYITHDLNPSPKGEVKQ
jgi:DtxR family Mn-dependent transcriptional regulator